MAAVSAPISLNITGPITLGGTLASSGSINLPNNSPIVARNAADSADINLIKLDTNNIAVIGASGGVSITGPIDTSGNLIPHSNNGIDVGSSTRRVSTTYTSTINDGTNTMSTFGGRTTFRRATAGVTEFCISSNGTQPGDTAVLKVFGTDYGSDQTNAWEMLFDCFGSSGASGGWSGLTNMANAGFLAMTNEGGTTGFHDFVFGVQNATGATSAVIEGIRLKAAASPQVNFFTKTTVLSTGAVGINVTSPPANQVFTIAQDSTYISTGVSQYAVAFNGKFGSGATTLGVNLYSRLATAAVSFTMANGYAVYIDTPSIGAGSTVTTAYGIYIASQTGGGTNYAIYSAGGQSYHAGNFGIGIIPIAPFQVKVASNVNLVVEAVSGAIHLSSVNDANTTYEPFRIDGSAVYINSVNGNPLGFGTTSPNLAGWTHSATFTGASGSFGIEIENQAGDGDNIHVGALSWHNVHSAANNGSRLAQIEVYTQGATTSNRGGKLLLYTRANGVGASLKQGLVIDNLQQVAVGDAGSPNVASFSYAFTVHNNIGGSTGLELVTEANDGDAQQIAALTCINTHSAANNSGRLAEIIAQTQGVTTSNRGGKLIFRTRANGVGASLPDRVYINNVGYFGIYTDPSYPLDVGNGTAGITLARIANTSMGGSAGGVSLALFDTSASGNSPATIRFVTAHPSDWKVGASMTAAGAFEIYDVANTASRLLLDTAGQLKATHLETQTGSFSLAHGAGSSFGSGVTGGMYIFGVFAVRSSTGSYDRSLACGGIAFFDGSNWSRPIQGASSINIAVSDSGNTITVTQTAGETVTIYWSLLRIF